MSRVFEYMMIRMRPTGPMTTFNESTVEAATLDWLAEIGWQTAHGPDIAPDMPDAERTALRASGVGKDGCVAPSLA